MTGTVPPELRLHNSLTRRREIFVPLDPSHVRMYVCGPTVYDLAHLGNARPVVVFDVLARLLRRLYPRVTYVRNITDVDDKINARAAESGEPIGAITARTTADFHADMAALGALPPDIEPRATGHVSEMIELISRLIAGGHAYAAEGHVLFSVASFSEYGRLSGRSPDELLAGARVEVAPYKRDAGDFVLWKPSPPDLPGWDSPWGRGRPGWHIECSAMSWRYLGADFDIHGGGQDLIFPHHENELAQSCCAFPGSAFARVWLHNGMLLVGGEKMSKSQGNFLTVRDALSNVNNQGEIVRFFLLKSHYRSTLDYTGENVNSARRELESFYQFLKLTPSRQDEPLGQDHMVSAITAQILGPLFDDLNVPGVIANLHTMRSTALAQFGFRSGDKFAWLPGKWDLTAPQWREIFVSVGQVLGILQDDPKEFERRGLDFEQEKEIVSFISLRESARARRDFSLADSIRKQLADRGIILEDGADGTTWRRA